MEIPSGRVYHTVVIVTEVMQCESFVYLCRSAFTYNVESSCETLQKAGTGTPKQSEELRFSLSTL